MTHLQVIHLLCRSKGKPSLLGAARTRGNPSLAAASAACQWTRDLFPQLQNNDSPTLLVYSDREMMSVKHLALLGQQMMRGLRGPCPESNSDQGEAPSASPSTP